MRNASLEDFQLLAESEILQRDLFVAAKDQKDHPKKREGCVQHEAGSVSASSLKLNRLRDRWDLARDRSTSNTEFKEWAFGKYERPQAARGKTPTFHTAPVSGEIQIGQE